MGYRLTKIPELMPDVAELLSQIAASGNDGATGTGGPPRGDPPDTKAKKGGGGDPELRLAFEMITLAPHWIEANRSERRLVALANMRAICASGLCLALIPGIPLIMGFSLWQAMQGASPEETKDLIYGVAQPMFWGTGVGLVSSEVMLEKNHRHMLKNPLLQDGFSTHLAHACNKLESGFNSKTGTVTFFGDKQKHSFAARYMTREYIIKRAKALARRADISFKTLKSGPASARRKRHIDALNKKPIVPRFW